MAGRKPALSKDDSPKGPLELKLTHEEAASKLQVRIAEGQELINAPTNSENQYEQLKISFNKWDDYNGLLLLNLFSRSDISDEYNQIDAYSYSFSEVWYTRYQYFVKVMASKVAKLESIVGRLELITVTPSANPIQTKVTTITKPQAIFIGHGRSKLWAIVKSFLNDDHGINSFSFESESHVSESIAPILEGFLDKATFAILILTAEDETVTGGINRARQNVIHEAGLFQGKLGFKKVILLRQDGIEDFSNVAGLQYIPFSGENIDQTFHAVSRTLKREGII